MRQRVRDFYVDPLYAWGVPRIVCYPADGIDGVMGALNRAHAKIEFIQVRYEEIAAFLASAYAKFTRESEVCLFTGGPGATHLITGLYDAKMDHEVVLAIAGQAPRCARDADHQQALDLARMFADVADHIEDAQTTAPRGVLALIQASDLQDMPYEDASRQHGAILSDIGYSKPKVAPYDAELQRAAEVLIASSKVAILVGAGRLRATDEAIAVADRLGAEAAKALLGKAALPDDLPWVTGSIGYPGTKPRYGLMIDCATLLRTGAGFASTEFQRNLATRKNRLRSGSEPRASVRDALPQAIGVPTSRSIPWPAFTQPIPLQRSSSPRMQYGRTASRS